MNLRVAIIIPITKVTTRVTKAITKVIRAIKATKVIRVIIKETTKVSLVIHN